MTAQRRSNFVEGFNYYVPSMQGGADLGQLDGPYRVDWGKPPAAVAAAILTATVMTVAGSTTTFVTTFNPKTMMANFGRNLTVVASGAAATAVTITGRDYLGQPLREGFTLNGTTPVVGNKIFYYIDKVEWAAVAANLTVGFGAKLGLPYKTRAVYREYADQVVAAAGTLIAPVLTDPATATTADPRGQYTPTTTPTGLVQIEADLQLDRSLNAAGNGGLHGIKNYGG